MNVRNFLLSVLSAAFLFAFGADPGAARANGLVAFPPELEADLSAGATAIYYLQFDDARAHLDAIIRTRPDHPAAYFFSAMAKWYEITYDSLLQRDPRLDKEFEDLIDKTISVSRKFSKAPATEAAGDLYWGGGLGAKGWRLVSRRQWVKAYLSGKKGFALLEDAIRIEPELYDAYLGVGMYQYYAATLGPVLKVLSTFLVRGDRQEALHYLESAQHKSRYVRLEAAYFMWNAFMDEGRLAEAESKLAYLLNAIPQSPLFEWCEIQTLFYQKRWDDVLKKGAAYEHAARSGPNLPNRASTHQLLLAKVYYHCGLAALNMNNQTLARHYFDLCAAEPAAFQGWKTMALLRRGELSDIEGNRVRAMGDYRVAAAMPDVWDSKSLAKSRLKSPYRSNGHHGAAHHSPLKQWQGEIP